MSDIYSCTASTYHTRIVSAPASSNFSFPRGVTLRGCEDIDDAAVILLSKYTAAQPALPDALDALDIAAANGHDSMQQGPATAAADAMPTGPSYRNVSLQRTVLASTLTGLRKSEAPSNPHAHLQPVLDVDSESQQLTDRGSAQRQHRQSRQARSLSKPR